MIVDEHCLIPYRCSGLPPGPWLVFSPHPDDETFGMGGTIACAKLSAVPVDLVVMTDGSAGGNIDNPDELTLARRTELECAAELLGIRHKSYLDLPDRALSSETRAISSVQDILESRNYRSVFFPSPLEFHPDHRATSKYVWQAIQNTECEPIEVYHYEISTQSPINCLIDITHACLIKRQAMQCYVTQLEENN